MKKNKMMRVASALLVAVLLTTCAISGTFAKYTTTGTGSDSARVAKWGVVVNVTGTTFANQYDATATAKSVVSTEKVVAPGTSGNMVAATITGTPEVKVQVTYSAEVELGDNWTDKDGNFYCPLVFTVGSTTINGIASTTGEGGTTTPVYADADALETAIENAINTYTATYDAGTDLATATTSAAAAPSVSWSWPFSTSDANDDKDTFLGDKTDNNVPQISITMTVTVTQVD